MNKQMLEDCQTGHKFTGLWGSQVRDCMKTLNIKSKDTPKINTHTKLNIMIVGTILCPTYYPGE
jgi:hypothetical protein